MYGSTQDNKGGYHPLFTKEERDAEVDGVTWGLLTHPWLAGSETGQQHCVR